MGGMDTTQRLLGLMDGPPSRAPARVTESTALRGKRVLVADSDGTWVSDIRAVDDPYWLDPDADSPAYSRWQVNHDPPAGASQDRAVLHVAVCTEPDWYEWAHTRRRPEVREYAAYLVWVE